MNKKIITITIICCFLFTIIYIPTKRNSNSTFIVTYVDSAATQEKETIKNIPINLSQDEIKLLTQFIKQEVQNNDIQEKLGVGMVILNRTNNPNFPNTIKDVIYQPGYFLLPEEGLDSVEVSDTDVQITDKIIKMYNEKISITDKNNNDLSQSLYWIDPTMLTAEKLQELETQYSVLGRINNREFLR